MTSLLDYGAVLVRRATMLLISVLIVTMWIEPSVAAETRAVRAAADCNGVRVRAGASLARVMSSHGPRTTYCLAAGTYRVTRTIVTDRGDRVIGAGRNATFIDGSGLPPTASGIFATATGSYFAHLEIFGAPTPRADSGVRCSPNPDCGKAFSLRGDSLTLVAVDCHHNGGNCIGGGGSANVTVSRLNCWKNGSAYSMTSSFRYAACIKRAAAYDPGNNTTVTNSYIHDNRWSGLWCDHCKYGLFLVRNSRIIRNGANGIQWEMSGGWTSDDRAIIRDNVIRRNNLREAASWRGGISISSANDIVVSSNKFGGNRVAGVNIIYAESRRPPQPDVRGVTIRDNRMNGDSIRGCSLQGIACTGNT